MKVKQFLKKFLYASSSIKFVRIASRGGHEIPLPSAILSDPMDKKHAMDEINSTVISFRINGDTLVIYCD